MPKYTVDGKQYAIPDNRIEDFEKKYPNATIEYYNDGDIYDIPLNKREVFLAKLPNATTQQPIAKEEQPKGLLSRLFGNDEGKAERSDFKQPLKASQIANTTQGQTERVESPQFGATFNPNITTFAKEGPQQYAEGIGQGLKQGSIVLKEGGRNFIGEVANLITGSSLDDKAALAYWDKLQAEGKMPQNALTDEERKYHKRMLDDMAMKTDDNGSLVKLTEEEKQEHRDILAQDKYNSLIHDAIEESNGDIDKAKQLITERANDVSWGDKLITTANENMAKLKPTKGFGAWVGQMIPQMIPSASAIALSFVTKNPRYANLIGRAGIGTMIASTAGQSMMEARNAGANNAQVWVTGIADGAIEAITEKLPFDRYTKKLFQGTKNKIGEQLSKAVTDANSPARDELAKLLKKANAKLDGKLLNGKNISDYVRSTTEEGASEFAAEALQTITPMIYANPDEYPTFWEIIHNGIEGAKGGLFMGSLLSGASKGAEHFHNRQRRKNQGFVEVAEVKLPDAKHTEIGEIIGQDIETGKLNIMIEGVQEAVDPQNILSSHRFSFEEFDNAELSDEIEQSYDNGRTLESPQEMNDANNQLGYAAAEVRRVFGLDEDTDVDNFLGADPVTKAKEEREMNEKIGQVILDYLYAKATYDGMIDGVRANIEAQQRHSDHIINQRANKEDGMIHPALRKVDDKPVYIVNGNIALNDDGTIDNEKSSESVVYLDAETGKLDFTKPSDFHQVSQPIDAEEEKTIARNQIAEELAQKASDKIDGVLPFQPNDVYSVLGADGTEHNLQVIADQGDGSVAVKVDGVDGVIPKDEIQQMANAYNLARRDAYNEERKAERMAEQPIAEQTTDVTTEPATALSQIPVNENGEQIFEDAPVETTYKALLEMNEGDQTEAIDTAQQMLTIAQQKYDEAVEEKPKSGSSVMEIQQAKSERKEKLNTLKNSVDYWSNVVGYQASLAEEVETPKAEEVAEVEPQQETIETPVEESTTTEKAQPIVEITPEESVKIMQKVEKRKNMAKAQGALKEKSRYAKEDAELGDYLDFTDYVMRAIATGSVRFKWSNKPDSATRGLGAHLGASTSNEERQSRIWMLNNEVGLYPEEAAEQLLTSYAEHLGYEPNIDTMTALSEIINVVAAHPTAKAMMGSAQARHAKDSQQAENDYYEDEYLKRAAEENGMTVEEWIAFIDEYVAQYDDIKAIFVEAYLDYDQQNQNNNEQSTGIQGVQQAVSADERSTTNDNRGSEVLPTEQSNTDGGVRQGETERSSDEAANIESVTSVSDSEAQGAEAVEETEVQESTAHSSILSEEEYIDKMLAKRKPKTISTDEWEFSDEYVIAYNEAADGYPDYIKGLADSGELQKAFDGGTLGDQIAIRKSIQAAGYDVSDLISTNNKKKPKAKKSRGQELMDNLGLTKTETENLSKPNNYRFRSVYHGSGSDFEKFDHSFMGTGEGHQAFGWGTYVSEVEGIGKQYAKMVSKPRLTFNGEFVNTEGFYNPWRLVEGLYNDSRGKLREMRAKAERYSSLVEADDPKTKTLWEDVKQVLSNVRSGDLNMKPARYLYSIEIPDNDGTNYLEHDKSVPKEQLNKIKQALYNRLVADTHKGVEQDLKEELDGIFGNELDGSDVYGTVGSYIGSDKAASQFLNENGYIGISYPADNGKAKGARNYVIFNEQDLDITNNIRFRPAESAPVFYSNAEYAVKAVKQEKATPEQWLKMIEKNGGLKAGEDKWLGLSDWLKSSDKKTLTKQEVLDFIKENQIQIEEVEYAENPQGFEELKKEYDGWLRDGGYDYAWDKLIERYGYDSTVAFDDVGGELVVQYGNTASKLLGGEVSTINSTRLDYTTNGLDNKREIALTVPTIESWNELDEIHFGDAGQGRAIAWVRFGETTDADGNRVLVIDEVQSKRHQEGREKGYRENYIKNEFDLYLETLTTKYGQNWVFDDLSEADQQKLMSYSIRTDVFKEKGVPDAPFEKNWAELAMKRMLRYAAENGFDKIAWTTGEQQAERYSLGAVMQGLTAYKTSPNTYYVIPYNNGAIGEFVKEYDEKELAETFGKEIAVNIITNAENATEENPYEMTGDDLRIGGSGMKAFYDQMIPSFMNKYGKKWGVKVQNVTLPHLAKSSSVMHSIDVTDAMRESVMQGQPMFRSTELSNIDDAVEAKAEKVFNNTKAIATAYGIDNSIVVATSEADFKTKMLEAGVEDDYIDQEAIAVYIPETDEIVINSQKVASDKDLVESVVHEKAHNLTHNIDKWRNIYDAIIPVGEGRFVEFANNVLKENLSPIKSADEIIATFVGKSAILQTEDGRYLVRAMLNNRITSEDIISYLQSSFPSIYAQYGDVLTAMHPFIQDSLETIKKQYNERRNNVSVSRVGRETRPSNGGDAYRELATPTSDRGSSTIEGVSEVRREPSERRGRTVEERTQSRILAATSLAESLGVKLNVIEDVNDITDANSTMQRNKRGAKAWYVVATDQVYFVAPNATSIQDAEESVLHEVVAHKGLRDVVGRERFDAFLGKVYRGASPEIRKAITKLAAKNGWDFRVATEEYLASLAERGFEDKENRTFWEKVRDLFMDMLREAKIILGYNINDNDMRYMLWRTYQMQKSKGVMAAAEDVVMQQKLGVGNFRTRPVGEDDRVNTLFNEQLSKLNEETKDKIVLSLGYPSETLLGAGVKNKQMKLYGSKVFAKMKKHGFDVSELKDLPKAVAKPIAVFNNYETDVNRSILTELTTKDGNFLVSVKIGEGEDVEFNIVTSVFGKGDSKIANWISKGYGVYFDKEKTLNYLHHSAPIAEALSNSELSSITKIVENFENPTIEGTKNEPSSKVLFRSAGNQAAEDKRKAIRAEYDKIVNTGRKGTLKATKYNFIESMQDEMLSLKEYQELLKKHYGLEKLPSYLDAYMRENRISSAGYEEFLRFEDGVYEDMNSIIDEYINKGETYDNIKEYAIAKSGLERNREFTVRDYIDDKANEKLISKTEAEAQLAQVVEDLKNDVITPTEADAKRQQIQNLRSQNKLNAEDVKALKEDYAKKRDAYRKQLSDGHISYSEFNKLSDALAKKFTGRSIEDYSGLSAMAEKKGEKADKWQTVAQDVVEAFESKHKDTDKLWNAIKACNDAVLKKMSDSGLLNDDVYSHLRQQFVWYIPMSGFTEDTAEDVYSYVGNETGAFTPAVKKAAGRLSESDDPFAIIGNKMQGAILQGNRNLLKQTLLNLSRTYPTDLITEDKVWLVKQQDGTWETNMVDIPEGATSEEAAKLIKEHSEKMRKLKKQGLAMEQTNKLSVPYKVTVRSHKNDHEIVAYRNGVPVVMYVNGNPQLAKAINGKLKDRNINKFYELLDKLNRIMSANKTSWNPDFIAPNVLRDFEDAILSTFIDAGVKDAAKLAKTVMLVFPEVVRSVSGSKNMSGKYANYFEEFLQNGGETGYSHLRDVEKWKEINQRRWKRLNLGEKALKAPKEAFDGIGSMFSYLNRIAEDSTRFGTYVYNREKGKSIGESIKAAKDITTNFNKKGSGATEGIWGFLANFMRRWLLFFNPMVQGLYKHWERMTKNSMRYALVFAAMAGGGYLAAVLNKAASDDDDEEKKYFNQSDYTRRTNIMVYTGDGYVKIPLAPVFREMYALGDIMYSVQSGVITPWEGTKEVVNIVRSLFSLEGQSSLKDQDFSWFRFVIPQSTEFMADIEDNVTFTGVPLYKDTPWNKFDPEYQKVYKGTWTPLVKLSKAVNDILPHEGYMHEVDDQMAGKGSSKWINPAVWQHIIEEVAGGVGKTIGDVITVGDNILNKKETDLYNIPIAKRFYSEPDERTRGRILKNQYYNATGELEKMNNKYKKYTDYLLDNLSDPLEIAAKITEYWDSDAGKMHTLIKDSKSKIDNLDKQLKEAKDDATAKEITLQKENEMNNLIESLKVNEEANALLR